MAYKIHREAVHMFIFSIKTSKRKLVMHLGLIIALIIILGIFFATLNASDKEAVCPIGKYNLCVKDNEGRIEFLSQFGWTVSNEPIEITTVTIPSEFNSTYEKYNDIQREQGLDLSKYKEKTCTRYTYQVLNYKDAAQGVRANVLVLNDKVIGGDVSSVLLNGFIHGFCNPDKINAQTFSSTIKQKPFIQTILKKFI